MLAGCRLGFKGFRSPVCTVLSCAMPSVRRQEGGLGLGVRLTAVNCPQSRQLFCICHTKHTIYELYPLQSRRQMWIMRFTRGKVLSDNMLRLISGSFGACHGT